MFTRKTFRLATALAASLALSGPATAAWDLNMPVGVTPISTAVYDLHMTILWVCVVIGIVVFGAMFYSMAVHRKSLGAEPAQFHHSTFAEIVWTIIPFVILVGMAVPATRVLVAMEDTSEADMTVKVTGYQWKWRYDYLEDEVSFYSNLADESRAVIFTGSDGTEPVRPEHYLLQVDREVVLPTKTKIRFLLTSDDVIHAWWVPALGQKKDAIPGYINEIWTYINEPGVYRGQCAELCGKDHGFMPIVVNAMPMDDYKAWLAEQKGDERKAAAAAAEALTREWARDELMAKGESIYNGSCAACHKPDGTGTPGAFPPIAGSPVANGPLAAHLALVLKGKPGTAMAPFGAQLSDVDIAAVLTYQRNAFGNTAGDVVQPKQVQAAR